MSVCFCEYGRGILLREALVWSVDLVSCCQKYAGDVGELDDRHPKTMLRTPAMGTVMRDARSMLLCCVIVDSACCCIEDLHR